MASNNKAMTGLDPLKDLLGDVIARLEALESKVGVVSSSSAPGGGIPKSPIPTKGKFIGRWAHWTKALHSSVR
jgi:hypothetical protein